jgi:O-antigen/teichoic acid export membrane protein
MNTAADPDRFVRTDAVEDDVALAAARGGVVQIGAQAVRIAMFAASGIVLARLLTPEDFGLMGMAASVVAIVVVIRDFGFPMAAVHRQGLRHEDVSALFWVSLRLNVALTLLVVAAAPLLARIYGEQELIAITVVIGAASFVSSLGAQHESLLIRQMRFATLRAVELGSTFIALVAGVLAAILGAGYWALVLQAVVLGVSQVVLVWRACGWRPARRVKAPSDATVRLSELIRFGRDFTIVRALRHVSRNVDRIIVGLSGGATQLGYYDNGSRWAMYPILQIERPLESVAVAGLSRLQDQDATYRAAARRGMTPVLAVALPALAFLAVEADSVIPLLLGERWADSVPIFRIICIAAIGELFSRTTTWLYLSRGDTHRQLRWALVSFPITVGAVIAGAIVEGGAIGVATGFTVAVWALLLPGVAYCLRASPVRVADYVAASWRPIVAAVTGIALLLVVEQTLHLDGDLARVTVAAGVFATAFGVAWVGLPGGRAATRELVHLLRLAGGGRRPRP